MDPLKQYEIPGRLTVFTGNGNLSALRIESDSSVAEIYPHGAHVTHFQKRGEEPLLFMSAASEFAHDKPIRGGVPVIFPWFGPREGMPIHGYARVADWDLVSADASPDGSVSLRFRLPSDGRADVIFVITVGEALTMELAVTNTGDSDFSFENCLHTYFKIGDIHQTEITGLRGVCYFDKVFNTECIEAQDTLRIDSETDRVYQDTEGTVEIYDSALARAIRVRKSGSKSTVVWNPWIEKSTRMADFGDEEYPFMVCVESGNVGVNAIHLAPGETSVLKVELETLHQA